MEFNAFQVDLIQFCPLYKNDIIGTDFGDLELFVKIYL